MRTVVVCNTETAVSAVIPVWLMQRNPSWYVRGCTFTAQYSQRVYSVLPLPNCPSTITSIKYSEQSQINKRKCIVKTSISSPLLEGALHKCWREYVLGGSPPAGTHPCQSHLTPTWDLAFVWTLSLRVCFTRPLSLSLSDDTHGWSPACSQGQELRCPCPAKRSRWLHLCWLQV